jgi:hypothetical protein
MLWRPLAIISDQSSIHERAHLVTQDVSQRYISKESKERIFSTTTTNNSAYKARLKLKMSQGIKVIKLKQNNEREILSADRSCQNFLTQLALHKSTEKTSPSVSLSPP